MNSKNDGEGNVLVCQLFNGSLVRGLRPHNGAYWGASPSRRSASFTKAALVEKRNHEYRRYSKFSFYLTFLLLSYHKYLKSNDNN